MRIALTGTGALGIRTARLLLAEPGLEALGVAGTSSREGDSRLRPVRQLSDWDALVSDAHPNAAPDIDQALQAGLPLVAWADDRQTVAAARQRQQSFREAGSALLVGCNLRSGIGPALAAHQAAQADEVLETVLGWTESGRPLRRGEAVPFPDPLGPLWARPSRLPYPSDSRQLAAPADGPWAGVVARLNAVVNDGVVTRTVGVADDELHLQAIALAAGALAVLDGAYRPGLQWVEQGAAAYLERALSLGLEVAAFTEQHNAAIRPGKPPP
ncbi:MAG: hypothetical protein ACRDXD_03520 [Acidimicrobiia bacterium]